MSLSHNCPCTDVCPLQRAMETIGGEYNRTMFDAPGRIILEDGQTLVIK